MTNWLVAKTGSDSNGGTSIAVNSTGTDGIVSSAGGTTKITSISATWTSALVGQGIYASSSTILRLISAVQASQTVATAVTASGLTTFTSVALFNATMLGCAVSGPGIAAGTYISAYTNSSSMTLSAAAGAGFGTGSAVIGPLATTTGTTAFTSATGQTWNVGGMLLTFARSMVTASGLKNAVAAADSIYVGGGVYRETVANTLSGTAGNAISIIGDVDGAKTGQSGQVTLSAYTTSDTAVPSATVLLALAATTNLSFSLISFIGGSASVITSTAAAAAANYTFTDCLINGTDSTAAAVAMTSSTTGLALGVVFDRCVIICVQANGIFLTLTTTASGAADWDALSIIRNCLIVVPGAIGIEAISSGTAAFNGGGVRVYDCTFLSNTGFRTISASRISVNTPCEIHNSLLICSAGINAATSGQITGSYNDFCCGTPATLYTYGTGDVSNSAGGTATYKAPLLELGQSLKWAGVLRQFMAPDGQTSPLLGAGNSVFTGNYPTVDWANRPRPSGGKSASASVGAYELHDYAIQNTGTVPTGYTSSGELIGPGDQDLWVPVDATATVITIQLYQGSGYTGATYASAQIVANAEIGVVTNTQTCASTLSSWQTLTFPSQTPTAAGWIKVRVSSFDTAGTGTLFFAAVT